VRRQLLPRLLFVPLAAALVLSGCGGEAEDEDAGGSTTTTEPASQFGSSMGTEDGDVADVVALGDGPADGEIWEVPVGLSVCGRFVDLPSGQPVGGVTAGPFSATVDGTGDGETPTLGDLAVSAGIGLEAGRLTMPADFVPPELDSTDPPTPLAGATLSTGDLCGETVAEVQVWVYSAAARESGDGILVVTQDLSNIPFSEKGMTMVIAFTPESSLPTLPPSAMGG
jgi:hypothetical protein